MRKILDSIPARYDLVVTKHNAVELQTSYFGPCPWCKEIIYTTDVCSECGKFVDLS